MKLYEEFKLFENMWDKAVAESIGAINEQELDACLTRVSANSKKPLWFDPDGISGIYVSLSKEDLKKALRIGTDGDYTVPGKGVTIPAQLVDEAYLTFEADYEDPYRYFISVKLGGEHPSTGEAACDFDKNIAMPCAGSADVGVFDTVNDAKKYFMNTLVSEADKEAHRIIERAWKNSGYTDYNGITDYKIPRVGSSSGYVVIFKDDPNNPIYTGAKPDCEGVISQISGTPYAKAHGGLEIKQA